MFIDEIRIIRKVICMATAPAGLWLELLALLLGFNISEAFPYSEITGQNWSPSREIPGSRDLTFFLNKEKLTIKNSCKFQFCH